MRLQTLNAMRVLHSTALCVLLQDSFTSAVRHRGAANANFVSYLQQLVIWIVALVVCVDLAKNLKRMPYKTNKHQYIVVQVVVKLTQL